MMIDFSKYIPKPLLDVGGAWINYRDKIQDQIDYYLDRITALRNIFIPEQTEYINEIANLVGAYLSQGDSDTVARQKTQRAIRTHKNLPVFSEIYKPVIQAITGIEPTVFRDDLLVFRGFILESSILEFPSELESSGYIVAPKPKGYIYIDLHTIPSPTQLENIVNQIKDLVPIYFKVSVGYSIPYDSDAFTLESSLLEGINLLEESIASASEFIVLSNV